MAYELKAISPAGVPAALAKAERYRLLNDPSAAESICLDILAVAPEHQEALVLLVLARTDQFVDSPAVLVAGAREVLPQITDPYRREYYAGVIAERQAKALLRAPTPGSDAMAYEAFREAMAHYEAAMGQRPAGNDEALLRWNTCARILNARPDLAPRAPERYEPVLED
jgi:hypothetical protein